MKIRNIESSFVWLHRLADLFIPSLTLYLVIIAYDIEWITRYQNTGGWTGVLMIAFNQFNGLYRSWRGRSLFQDTIILIKSWLLVWALLILLIFMLKISDQFSRFVLSVWFITTPLALILYRTILRSLLTSLFNNNIFTKDAAIYGSGYGSSQLTDILQKNPWLGYRIVDIFDDKPDHKHNTNIAGGIIDLITLAKSGAIQTVYIALPMERGNEIRQLLNGLSDTTVAVKYIPDFFSFDLLNASMATIDGIPIINIYDTPLNDPAKAFVKRLEDIVFTTLILILITPILLFVAILIKSSSSGPIIFKQKRYGLNGTEINIYKFRTMTSLDDGDVIKQATKNDSRITKLGAILRKTSLDELPQFFNVLKGEMSIVGPRPHAVAHNEEYRKIIPTYMQRHLVKPGITGWAQINGWRGETDTLEKMQKRIACDLYYINHWNVWMDIKIIVLTIFKGFVDKNAY